MAAESVLPSSDCAAGMSGTAAGESVSLQAEQVASASKSKVVEAEVPLASLLREVRLRSALRVARLFVSIALTEPTATENRAVVLYALN